MGDQTDFDFGHNLGKQGVQTVPKDPPPWSPAYTKFTPTVDAPADKEEPECLGFVECRSCGKYHGYCEDVKSAQADISIGRYVRLNRMDLKSYRSTGKDGKKKGGFSQREFIDATDLPKNKTTKWKIDEFRPAKKKGKLIGFLDITYGKVSRVMGVRKGFTLDAIMDALGTNTDKWKGKTLNLVRGGDEGQYVNVSS